MVNEIIDLYNSGMKMRDVAKQLNISHHKVSKVLKECGVKIRIRNDYGNPAQAPDFAERLPPNCGLGSPEISANNVLIVISRSLVTVSSWIPVPANIFLKVTPVSVELTVKTAPSSPT